MVGGAGTASSEGLVPVLGSACSSGDEAVPAPLRLRRYDLSLWGGPRRIRTGLEQRSYIEYVWGDSI